NADCNKVVETISNLAEYSTRALNDDFEDLRMLEHGDLWVDRYKPKDFGKLLTEDVIKTDVLRWVGKWRHVVFGTDKKEAEKAYKNLEWKMMMIHGPPGLGKTTMAHTIARTAGYSVVEINASDDRSGEKVKDLIKRALEVKQNIKEGKPNLIIVDEIDGALAGDNNKRPIICICNDAYSSVLKNLKQRCLLVGISKPSVSFLAKRLKEICEREKLLVDMRCLSALCEITNCDIRSCLFTLQFFHRKLKQGQPLTLQMLIESSIGMKDQHLGYFSELNEILFVSDIKQQRVKQEKSKIKSVVDKIDFGNFEKLFQGCFENYLNLKFHDDNKFSKLISLHDWILFYDRIQKNMNCNQYAVYSLASFHLTVANRNVNNYYLIYPKSDYEANLLKKQNRDLITRFMTNSPFLKSSNTIERIRIELISKFLRIIDPNVLSVNPQILKSKDKQKLERIIDLMVFYKLDYIEASQNEYKLSTNISSTLLTPLNVKKHSYAILQYIHSHISNGSISKTDLKSKKQPLQSKLNYFSSAQNIPKQETKKIKQESFPFFYKYNEGFSNAVRKSIKIKDLI
ncbi:P-loop containing nucleoside triphosphate hydrolase protein, partial [Rozella allomycis CSF55]